ncbi:MAG: SDR family oxidoreductase [Bacteroidales bacterium]|nr:SDR family oxidoreductase [Bacteroidales bacterium]
MENKKILITGGAGFIGSNLVEYFLKQGNQVTCLDNFLTGHRKNIESFLTNPNFKLIEGDIRNYEDCQSAVEGCEYVFHQAALGSVPRSINDPMTTTDINIGGFVKMLFAAKEAKVKRFIYAASSSTYGDSQALPKIEENIGKPLSPYAITKYANELYAENFSKIYDIETIGLRYFNVFGKNQDPNGAYAAVIPLFIKQLINHESPIINGDGTYSRDFTYIKNVIQMNELAASSTNASAINQVFNTAVGERNNLNQLTSLLKQLLSKYDIDIANIEIKHGPNRAGDIPHSHASVDKAKTLLNYKPEYSLEKGLKEAIDWYWEDLK